MGKVGKFVISALSAAILFGLYWFFLPPLSIFYWDGFTFIATSVVVIAINIFMWLDKMETSNKVIPSMMVITTIVILLAMFVGGSAVFNDQKLRTQIGDVQEKEFDEVVTQLDNAQIPTVDADLAKKQGEKLLGEDAGLGSRVELGDFTIQSVNGKLEYVAPLQHTGFFKWMEIKTTPGYIAVSATDSSDVKYVNTLEDGTPIGMRYQESAYFGDDLRRYLVMECGYRNVGLTNFEFETDDSGRPFYIINTFENTVFWGAAEVTGTIICDPQTGETAWYAINETPEWVDRIQPDYFIRNQLSNYGSYVNGFWNSVFAKTDVLKVSDGVGVVYSGEDCYYYTGMTSVGADNSTVGFYMVDTRTKEVIYFPIAGATEEAARSSAQGLVQADGYTASYPIPLNVNGVPTYFMTLKDNEGLVKKYAMVNIQNYSLVAIGDNIAESKRAYMQVLASNGNSVVFSSEEAYGYTTTGVVTRIESTVENGNSYFYMIIDDDMTKLFSASYTISDELAITAVGDQVTVKYIDDGNRTISLSSFDNLGINMAVSEDQEKKDQIEGDVPNPLEASDNNSIVDVDSKKIQEQLDSMSDEEKAVLLKDKAGEAN